MVTHDRYFLDRVCSHILEIDNQQLYTYHGNYSYYLQKHQERQEQQDAELARANNLYRRELEWMRRQPQARGTKAQYRIDAFNSLEEKVKKQRQTGNVRLDMKASYIGSKIFEAKYISKSFGDTKILQDFYYNFGRYEKMGIVGNNGTGKSTFVKMLVGEMQPDKGVIDVGETVRFGYFSQAGMQFDEQMKVIDAVQKIADEVVLGDGEHIHVSQFLQHFLFSPARQHDFVYKLSGGERRRLYLCTVLMQNPNFLVLDEPTNDLDIVTLQILEEYLQQFKGCVIVVSHDRYFMDKVVDHLLVFHGNARVQDFPGNYTDYRLYREVKQEEERKARAEVPRKANAAAAESSRPSKPRERRLTYQERKELEQLTAEIDGLESERKEIENAMAQGTLAGNELISKSERIGEINRLLDEKGDRWLELSEIGG